MLLMLRLTSLTSKLPRSTMNTERVIFLSTRELSMLKKQAWINLIAVFGLLLLSAPSMAQNQAQDEEKEIPPSEVVTVETSDRVQLKCQWYPGVDGKESVPVILVHDWGTDRSEMLPLAEHLQKELGCAVIVPDLRGHGGSTNVIGMDDPLDFEDFKKAQIASVVMDIEGCKKFLMRKNNVGELNIEMLTLIATHKTCVHAINWSVTDWSWPLLADGTKQGQDVKALFLISPIRRFGSISMNRGLKVPAISGKGMLKPVTVAILWGSDDDTTSREAKSIYNLLEKTRTDPSEYPANERWDRQDLFQVPYRTSSVGEELLTDAASSKIMSNIGVVIQKKIIDNKDDFRWQDRSN